MPLQKLSREELSSRGNRSRGANQEWVMFLRGLKIGEGGKVLVADEGITRQSVKNRLNSAAGEANVSLKYHRSGAEEVVFEVTDSPPRRRGRKPKGSM
jgi:hypothetical protein